MGGVVVDTVVVTVVCVPGLAVAGATVTNTQKHYCYQHTETLLLPTHRNTTFTSVHTNLSHITHMTGQDQTMLAIREGYHL